MRAVELGRFSWAAAFDLGDVVSGRVPLARRASDVTLFESQGIALEDLALAERVIHLARERGVGTEIA